MTKQEEIRDQMVEFANENYVLRPRGVSYQECMVDDMLNYLHSQGVVMIKVDKELFLGTGSFSGLGEETARQIYSQQKAKAELLEAGYVAVIPLIQGDDIP